MTTAIKEVATSWLLEFWSEQSIFGAGDVQAGGYSGLSPAVLICSEFYCAHQVNVDEVTREFDADEAEKRIRVQEKYSELTDNFEISHPRFRICGSN